MNNDWIHDIPTWVTRGSGVLTDVAGVALVATMLMTVYDIAARNLGFGSIEPVVELTTLAVVIIAAFGLASTTIRAGHVIIDLFTQKNRLETNRIFDSFWLVMMAVFLFAAAFLSVREGLILHGEGTTTEVLEWSVLSFYIPPVAGWIVAGAVALWIGSKVLLKRGEGHAPEPDEV